MQDRRQRQRRRTFLAGTMVYRAGLTEDSGVRTMDCVVRDISDEGALLLTDDPLRAPCEMDVTLGVEDGGRRRARVVWRGETGVGVIFVPAERNNVIPFPTSQRSGSPDVDRERLVERIARFVRPRDTDPL